MINIGKLENGKPLSLPEDAVTQTFAILAKRGVGKTYLALLLAEQLYENGNQVIIADPVGVCSGLRTSSDGNKPGLEFIIFGGDDGDVPLEKESGETIARFLIQSKASAVLDLSLLGDNAQKKFTTDFARYLYEKNRDPLHLILDEADVFAPQQTISPGDSVLLGAMQNIVRRGRARGIGISMITQRAAVLNKSVLSQIETLFVLRNTNPYDKKAIQSWLQVHSEEKRMDSVLEQLATLPVGTAFVWSPAWLGLLERVKIDKRKTFDSSSTPTVQTGKKRVVKKAPIDLEKLTLEIRQQVEELKSNDPSELKKKIEILKRENQKLQQSKSTSEAAKRLERELALCKTDAEKKRTLFINTLSSMAKRAKAASLSIEEVVKAAERIREEFAAKEPSVGSTVGAAFDKASEAVEEFQNVIKRIGADSESLNSLTRYGADPAKAGTEVTGGKKKILSALAQYQDGLSDKQIGTLTSLSSSSGTFSTYLGALRSSGFITGEKTLLRITELGLAALGDYEPLPLGRDLYEHWKNKLGDSGVSRMLTALFESYPNTLTSEELGSKAGLNSTTGTFSTYLGKLRTLNLVTGKKNELRATDNFFI